MRFGISDEATNQHLTTTICLEEIQKCLDQSTGPAFIVIIRLEIVF